MIQISGTKLTFKTIRVGIFAIVKLKPTLKRHLLVFLKPIDIEMNNHVFLQVFAVQESKIKVIVQYYIMALGNEYRVRSSAISTFT